MCKYCHENRSLHVDMVSLLSMQKGDMGDSTSHYCDCCVPLRLLLTSISGS